MKRTPLDKLTAGISRGRTPSQVRSVAVARDDKETIQWLQSDEGRKAIEVLSLLL